MQTLISINLMLIPLHPRFDTSSGGREMENFDLSPTGDQTFHLSLKGSGSKLTGVSGETVCAASHGWPRDPDNRGGDRRGETLPVRAVPLPFPLPAGRAPAPLTWLSVITLTHSLWPRLLRSPSIKGSRSWRGLCVGVRNPRVYSI